MCDQAINPVNLKIPKLMKDNAQDNHLIRSGKLKVYIEAIRTHPEVRGTRKALPWAGVKMILLESKRQHYDLDPSSYRKWYNDKEGKQSYDLVIKNVRAFVSLPRFAHIITRKVRVASGPTDVQHRCGSDNEEADNVTPSMATSAATTATRVNSKMDTHEYKNIMVDGEMRETYKFRHPAHMTLVSKKSHAQYKQDAEKWKRFRKLSDDNLMSEKRCNMSRVGTAAVWTMLTIAPTLSPDTLSMILPLAYMMFADILSLDLDLYKTKLEKIAASAPSPTTLRNKMMDLGYHCQQEVKSCLQDRGGTPVFLACDAGNRKGSDHLCKYVSYRCNKLNKVCVNLVDSLPTTGKSSQSAASAIAQSMESVGVQLWGITTDSGGGGVLDSLAECLNWLGATACNFTRDDKSASNFTVAACALHGLNLMISKPWEEVDGVGGLHKQNALQAVHTVHWLQAHTWGEGGKCFNALWAVANPGSDPPLKINEPVYTRWWHVGTAMANVMENYDGYLKWAEYVNKTEEKTSGNLYVISGRLTSMMKNPYIRFTITFLAELHNAFWNPHLRFLQSVDTETGLYGFRAHRMPLHTYVMRAELDKLQRKFTTGQWEGMCEFARTRAAYSLLPDADVLREGGGVAEPGKPTAKRVMARFWELAAKKFGKHFLRWRSLHATFLLGETEPDFIKAVAEKLVLSSSGSDGESDGSDGDGGGGGGGGVTYTSCVHGCDVDINNAVAYFVSSGAITLDDVVCAAQKPSGGGVSRADVLAELRVLAAGGCTVYSGRTPLLLRYVQHCVLPVMHTTHRVEAGIREVSLCTSATKSCAASTSLVAGRDQCVLPVKAEAAAAAEERRAKRQRRSGAAAGVDVTKPARARATASMAVSYMSSAIDLASRLRLPASASAWRSSHSTTSARAASAGAEQRSSRLDAEGNRPGRSRIEDAAPASVTLTPFAQGVENLRKLAGMKREQYAGWLQRELRHRGADGSLSSALPQPMPTKCRALVELLKALAPVVTIDGEDYLQFLTPETVSDIDSDSDDDSDGG